MGGVASFALGPPRPPPHWRLGLLHVWIAEAPVAWAWGPLSLWDHQGPRYMGVGPPLLGDHRVPRSMGVGASFALESSRPPLHGRGGPLGLGTTEAPAPVALARGPPAPLDHRGPRRMGVRASFALCCHLPPASAHPSGTE